MIQRINNYLLTHYPLVWNTRLVWVACINGLSHVLFFIAGIFSIDAESIADNYSVENVGGGNNYTLSVLCGLVVLIVWCIFYLRNNAFKSYYRIGKWYLAKEFAIIFFIILTSVTYFMTYEYGVRIKVRSITNNNELVQEINTVNKACVYVAGNKSNYFILNSCSEREMRRKRRAAETRPASYINDTTVDYYDTYSDGPYEPDVISVTDSNRLYRVRDSMRIRTALRRPDAFSYLHYCTQAIYDRAPGVDSSEIISQRNKRWLQQGRKDSVRASLQALFAVLNKYKLGYRLGADSIINDVFSDSVFTADAEIPTDSYFDLNGTTVENTYYFDRQNLMEVFNFIEDCQPGNQRNNDLKIIWIIVGYVTLSLSILMLCYRRFSRKIFLISIVGTLVWAILTGLIAAGSSSDSGFAIILLILCFGFGIAGVLLLRENTDKTVGGVLLNWHIYLVPFAVILVAALISLDQNYYDYNFGNMSYDDYMRLHHTFSYWVKENLENICLVNLPVSFLYVAFLFNRWAKRWQLMAEE